MLHNVPVLIVCLVILLQLVHVRSYSLIQRSNSSSSVLPFYDYRDHVVPSQVNISISISTVQYARSSGQFSMSGSMDYFWRDSRFEDSTTFGNASFALLPRNTWYPDIDFSEGIENDAKEWIHIKHNSLGHKKIFPENFFSITCFNNGGYNIFDAQICAINLTVWSCDCAEFALYSEIAQVLRSKHTDDVEWDLMDHDIDNVPTSSGGSFISFTLYLRRKPDLSILDLLLPLLCLGILKLALTLAPAETAVVTLFTGVSVLFEQIPETTKTMPIIVFHVTWLIGFPLCIAFLMHITKASVWIYVRYNDVSIPTPSWCKKLSDRISCLRKDYDKDSQTSTKMIVLNAEIN